LDNYKLAELHTKRDSLKVRWYVAYYYKNPETFELERHVLWISSRLKTITARKKKGFDIVEQINKKLKEGWNPYQQDEVRFTNIVAAIDYVVKIKSSSARKRTSGTYRSFANTFIDWLIESKLTRLYIEDFNFRYAIQFMDYIKINKEASNRTYNNYVQQMRTFFNALIEREYITFNPFLKIKYLPEQQPSLTAFSELELKKLKEYLILNDPQMWLICQFVFYTFIRPNELVQLCFNDLDLKLNKITIQPHVSKNKLQQVVAIPEHFAAYLKDLNLDQYPGHYFLFSKDLKPGLVAILPNTLAKIFKKHREEIGISKKLYDLKHTGAGMAIENGVNVWDLKNQLRHSSLDITTGYLNKFKAIASEDFRAKFPKF
jgi:integrase